MATKQDRNALVKCEYCGEYYSVTYKQCPFCDEYEADPDEIDEGEHASHRSGGKRLVTNTRGGGYGRGWTPVRIFLTILSIAMIIAAGCIVFTVIKPLVDRGKVPPPTDNPTPPPATESVLPSPTSDPNDPLGIVDPNATGTPTATPSPTPSRIPSTQTANSFTINKSDFTLSRAGETYRIKAAFSPAGSTGVIDWVSSNPNVASVASDGTVTALTRGTVTVTATMAGGIQHTCIVRCTFPASSAATASPSPSESAGSGGPAGLNRSDFTLSKQGETYRLKLSGGTTQPTWSSSNSEVASISSDGTVTAVSEGTCTITCSIDGQSLKCIVRVNYE